MRTATMSNRVDKEVEMDELNREELLRLLDAMYGECMLLSDWDAKAEEDYQKIVALIRKPRVTKEWLEHKAVTIYELCRIGSEIDAKNFFYSLIEEIRGK